MEALEDIYDSLTTKFEKLCKNKQIDVIKEYIIHFPYLLNYDDRACLFPIFYIGDLDLIKFCISNGAKLKNDPRYLYACTSNGFYDCVEYLLSIGFNLDDVKHYDGYLETITALKLRSSMDLN